MGLVTAKLHTRAIVPAVCREKRYGAAYETVALTAHDIKAYTTIHINVRMRIWLMNSSSFFSFDRHTNINPTVGRHMTTNAKIALMPFVVLIMFCLMTKLRTNNAAKAANIHHPVFWQVCGNNSDFCSICNDVNYTVTKAHQTLHIDKCATTELTLINTTQSIQTKL